MPEKKITCIVCPMGCEATVVVQGNEILKAEGLECQRGKEYVAREIKAPMRDFFTVVQVRGAKVAVCPVRSTKPVPKGKLAECSRELADVAIAAPVKAGDVIMRDILGLGVDMVATMGVEQAAEEEGGRR